MNDALVIRFLLALALMAGGVALYWSINRLLIRRVQQRHLEIPNYQPGVRSIVYFTTPECMPCKTVQRPALQRLKQHLGDQLNIIEVNAKERPDLAGQWGVLSVPTTFVIDASGELRHINHGVTRVEKLLEQVMEGEPEI
jgi:thiol-disulfide isomerase/thioredoxin